MVGLDIINFDFWPQGYNSQISLLAALFIAGVCSFIGVFAVLSRRALVSDVAGHATLPGIAAGLFMFWALDMLFTFPDSFNVAFVIAGGFISSSIGVFCVSWIQSRSTLKPDAAMAIVLGSFYGLGIAFFSALQRIPSLSIAGMDRFLLGQIVGTTSAELMVLAILCVFIFVTGIALYRTFIEHIFDPELSFLRADSFVQKRSGTFLIVLITLTIASGLKIVGALMIVAFMIFPVTTAGLFFKNHRALAVAAVIFGLFSAYIGVMMSLVFDHVPAGSMMILIAFLLFALSVLLRFLVRVMASLKVYS